MSENVSKYIRSEQGKADVETCLPPGTQVLAVCDKEEATRLAEVLRDAFDVPPFIIYVPHITGLGDFQYVLAIPDSVQDVEHLGSCCALIVMTLTDRPRFQRERGE